MKTREEQHAQAHCKLRVKVIVRSKWKRHASISEDALRKSVQGGHVPQAALPWNGRQGAIRRKQESGPLMQRSGRPQGVPIRG